MNFKNLLVSFSVLPLLAACATDPAQNDPVLAEHFDKIQVMVASDATLTCNDLQEQINSLEVAIQKMDHQDKYWLSKAQSDSKASAFAAAFGAGYASAGMGMTSQDANNNAMAVEAVEATYQQRHDYLVQTYMTRKCTPST